MNNYLNPHDGEISLSRLKYFENTYGVLPKSYSKFLMNVNGEVAFLRKNDDESILFYNLDNEPVDLASRWRGRSFKNGRELLDIAELEYQESLQLDIGSGEILLRY